MTKSLFLNSIATMIFASSCFTQKANYSSIKEDGPIVKLESPTYSVKKTPAFYVAPVIMGFGGYYYGSNMQIKGSDGVSKKGGVWAGILSALLVYGVTGEFQKMFAPKYSKPSTNPNLYISKISKTKSQFSTENFLQTEGDNLLFYNNLSPIVKIDQIKYLRNLKNTSIAEEIIGLSINQPTSILEGILDAFPTTKHKQNLLTNWANKTTDFNRILEFKRLYPAYESLFVDNAYRLVRSINDANKFLLTFPNSAKEEDLSKLMLNKIQNKSDVDTYLSTFKSSSLINVSGDITRIGNLLNNKLTGQGALKYGGTGTTYIGIFKNDQLNGNGYRYKNGNSYSGVFINNSLYGKGNAWYASGDTYSGEFKDDVPHGYGEYNWPNGEWYIGMFRNGERNGSGEYRSKNGFRFKGNFVNDKREGKFKVTKWTLLGLVADEWVVDYKNDELINQSQTKSELTDFFTSKPSSPGTSRNSSSDVKTIGNNEEANVKLVEFVIKRTGAKCCIDGQESYCFDLYENGKKKNWPDPYIISKNKSGDWVTDCGGVVSWKVCNNTTLIEALKNYYMKKYERSAEQFKVTY